MYRSAAGLVLALALTGCSVLRANEYQSSPFLPHPELLQENRSRAPFHGLWFADSARFSELVKRYAKVYIAPVDTTYAAAHFAETTPNQRTLQIRAEELAEIARYTHEKFKNAFSSLPQHPITVTAEPGPGILTVTLAIVEVRPTNTAVNVAGTVAGVFLPGGGLLKFTAKGSIAIEGMIRDGTTDELLMEFKDREVDKDAPFTVKDFQQYAHVRATVDEWANQLAEVVSTPPDHTVKGALPFTLLPY